jgi:hypothetical protein
MLAEDIGRRRAFNPASFYPASSAILAWLPIIITCPLQSTRLAALALLTDTQPWQVLPAR